MTDPRLPLHDAQSIYLMSDNLHLPTGRQFGQ